MARILPLEIGRLESDLGDLTGDPGVATLPIPSWLIEHPDGLVLFDTGLHAELQHSSERLGRSAAVFRPDFHQGEELAARLDAAGIRPSDITAMVFSHLHFDHCGGTVEIPDARMVVQEAEWAAANDERLIAKGIYHPDDFRCGHDVQTVAGPHDLFGDGAVACVPTPGHTKGHQSLRVELASGPVVLTGDCVYFESLLDDLRTPRFGADLARQRDSMRELIRLRDAEGCRLLFGHDEAQFRSLPADGLR